MNENTYANNRNNLKKIFLVTIGVVSAVLGLIGVFVPLLPSVPFFILATICFSKSSERLHQLFMKNRLIGLHMKNYIENKGMKLQAKIFFIVAQWIGISIAVLFFIKILIIKVIVLLIAVAVTVHILLLKTADE